MSMHAREAIGAVHTGRCSLCGVTLRTLAHFAVPCELVACPLPIAEDPRHKATRGENCAPPSNAANRRIHFRPEPSGGVVENCGVEKLGRLVFPMFPQWEVLFGADHAVAGKLGG